MDIATNSLVLAPTARTITTPMRALVQSGYGGPEVFRVGVTERPLPSPDEVLVQVHAAGIDRGTWHLMTGRPYLMRLMGFGFRSPKEPVAGLDLAGTVVAIGADVSRFRVGDSVFGIGRGAFAEYACAKADKLAHVPRGLAMHEAAVLGVSGMTAYQALHVGGVAEGEKVLVIGASGGVGSYAVQIARALGASVTGVCRTEKVDFVRGLGVDRVIDHRSEDFADGSTKYDLVLDIGGNAPLRRLRRAMTDRGRLVFVGGEDGGDLSGGFERQLAAAMLGPFVSQRFEMLMSEEHHRFLDPLVALCESGMIRPCIDRQVGLDEVGDALRELEAGRVKGKIVVDVRR